MKELKCNSCSKVWYVGDIAEDSQTSCPFCGESIKKEIQFDNIDSFDKAIYITVKKVGVDMLKTPSRLAAYMMDMAPGFKNEIRFVLKNISGKYANDIFKAFSDSTQDVDETFIRIKQRLIDEDLASEKWTDIVCNSFKSASLMMRGINPSVEVKNTSIKSESSISKAKPAVNNNLSSNILVSSNPTISKPKSAVNNNSSSNILGGSKTPISKLKPAVNYNSSSNILGGYNPPISKPKPVVNNNSLLDILDSGKCGDNAFWKLLKDCTLIIEGSGSMYDYRGRIWNDELVSDAGWYKYTSKIKKVEIGKEITNIGGMAFYECKSLSSVQLPDSLQVIGVYAFSDCRSLSSVKLPDSLQMIGGYAFSGCKSLSSIKLPESLQTIGKEAFSDCISLSIVELPDNLKTIERATFMFCTSLSSVKLPDNLQVIGGYAFYCCSSLSSIKLPESLQMIGEYAFSCCTLEIRIPAKAKQNMSKWDKDWNYRCNARIIDDNSSFEKRAQNFLSEITKYDVKKIGSYKPSEKFYSDLEQYCISVRKGKKADEYMSNSLVKRFGLKSEKIFLAIDIYYKVEFFRTGKDGVVVSQSGITTDTEYSERAYNSFLDLALANSISYHDYCVYADDRKIAYAYSSQKQKMTDVVKQIQKLVREDCLRYLES